MVAIKLIVFIVAALAWNADCTTTNVAEDADDDQRPLRIAQLAPFFLPVPPVKYGGTERVISWLTEELIRQGHHVTLFAPHDSHTAGTLVSHPYWPSFSVRTTKSQMLPYVWMADQVRQRANDFDIIHGHHENYFTMLNMFPGVHTHHIALGGSALFSKDLTIFWEAFPRVPMVSISDDQRSRIEAKNTNFVGTVYHGLPADLLPFTEKPKGNYLAFLGRINKKKGIEVAIKIAIATGIPLKVAAAILEGKQDYYQQTILPLIQKNPHLVELVGEIDDHGKGPFLGNALAVLFPIEWPEPFGLVMIEAMACGTPVIVSRMGSVPEVINDGVTGFIFDTEEQAIHAVEKVGQLDRKQIRAEFEEKYTVERMAKNYVKIYRKIIKEWKAKKQIEEKQEEEKQIEQAESNNKPTAAKKQKHPLIKFWNGLLKSKRN